MLRKGGAAGYGFGASSHELPRPNGSSYSGGGLLGGGKKSSAARRKRLVLRLGSIVAALFLIVLVARSRGGSKGGAAMTKAKSLKHDGEDVPAEHMKSEDTAAAAEKR